MMRHTFRALVAVVLGMVVLAGCAAKTPTLSDDESKRTHDGLYPVKDSFLGDVWARPDLDLAPYDKIMLQGAGMQFRPVKGGGTTGLAARSRNEFPLSEEQKSRLQEELGIAFTKEFAKSDRFELTDAAGADVLLIRGGLIDVVSKVPPDPIGRGGIFLESVGEATLLLELVDSQSGTVLVRAADRRAANRSGYPIRSNSVTTWNEVKLLANFWARTLRERLDDLDKRFSLD